MIAVFFTIAGDVGEIVSEEEVKLESLNGTTTLVPYLSPEFKGDQGHPLEQKVCTDYIIYPRHQAHSQLFNATRFS